MASENVKVIIGLIAVAIAVFILITALGYPTTSCSSGTGISDTCSTDTTATIGVIVVAMIGIVIGGAGIRTMWKNW
jgi:hypothetical protein